MALPTSDNTVNVTRLGSILSTLWGKIKTKFGTKADKVSNATNGNLASLDSNGNLVDSGVGAPLIVNFTFNSNGEPTETTTSISTILAAINADRPVIGIVNNPTYDADAIYCGEYTAAGCGTQAPLVSVAFTRIDNSGNEYVIYGDYVNGTDIWSVQVKDLKKDPRFWVGYKKKDDYLLVTINQISGGTTAESILFSFTGSRYGVMYKICFGMNGVKDQENGGFNNATPTLHMVEVNNWENADYNPLYTNGIAKYYFDSTNYKYYFLLKNTSSNRVFATIESSNYNKYSFSVISTPPSWIDSASNILVGHCNTHTTGGQSVGACTAMKATPVYVNSSGSFSTCTDLYRRIGANSSIVGFKICTTNETSKQRTTEASYLVRFCQIGTSVQNISSSASRHFVGIFSIFHRTTGNETTTGSGIYTPDTTTSACRLTVFSCDLNTTNWSVGFVLSNTTNLTWYIKTPSIGYYDFVIQPIFERGTYTDRTLEAITTAPSFTKSWNVYKTPIFNNYQNCGSDTQPVYINSNGQITACTSVNADTVDGFHFSTSTSGSATNTVYLV